MTSRATERRALSGRWRLLLTITLGALLAIRVGATDRECRASDEVACDEFMRDTAWTGKLAVVIVGHVRTIRTNLVGVEAFVKESAPATVDVFFHVWINMTDPCHQAALESMKTVATRITTGGDVLFGTVGQKHRSLRWHS